MSVDEPLSTVTVGLEETAFSGLIFSAQATDYGTERAAEPAIDVKGLKIRLGDRPIARDVRRLYERSHKELPPNLAIYDTFSVWIIPHALGAIYEPEANSPLGLQRPTVLSLGYEVDFRHEESAYTIDLMPQSQFVKKIEVGTEVKIDLGAEGNALLPTAQVNLMADRVSLGGGAHVQLAADAHLVGRVSFSLLTPVVQATGVSSSHCHWVLRAHEQPLLGDQMLLQTMLVPQGIRELVYKVRGYAIIKPRWLSFGAIFRTTWVEIRCPFPDGE
jgi:hypothetical protein